MERIDIRVHDEISNVAERYYGFTFRQWIFGIVTGVVVIPTWFYLSPRLGDDMTSWIVIIEALPIVFIGFIPVQEMPAEKIIPYWIRHYLKLAKPLEYKTDKQLLEEKEAKKRKKHKKAKSSVSNENVTKITRKEKKKIARAEKKKQQAIKQQRREQRELAKAKKKYGNEHETYELKEGSLNREDIESIIRLGKLLEEREALNEKEETESDNRESESDKASQEQ